MGRNQVKYASRPRKPFVSLTPMTQMEISATRNESTRGQTHSSDAVSSHVSKASTRASRLAAASLLMITAVRCTPILTPTPKTASRACRNGWSLGSKSSLRYSVRRETSSLSRPRLLVISRRSVFSASDCRGGTSARSEGAQEEERNAYRGRRREREPRRRWSRRSWFRRRRRQVNDDGWRRGRRSGDRPRRGPLRNCPEPNQCSRIRGRWHPCCNSSIATTIMAVTGPC